MYPHSAKNFCVYMQNFFIFAAYFKGSFSQKLYFFILLIASDDITKTSIDIMVSCLDFGSSNESTFEFLILKYHIYVWVLQQ